MASSSQDQDPAFEQCSNSCTWFAVRLENAKGLDPGFILDNRRSGEDTGDNYSSELYMC